MTNSEILFEEKQFLGHNRLSVVIRTVFTLFCFLGYYWSENPRPVQVAFFEIGSYPINSYSKSGPVFFILGISILLFSTVLIYVLNVHLLVTKDELQLKGFLTSRTIRIPRESIISIRKSRYKRNVWRGASYNLHSKGIIRFYTSGEDFVEITDKQGFVYRIGTYQADQLYMILNAGIEKKEGKAFNTV